MGLAVRVTFNTMNRSAQTGMQKSLGRLSETQDAITTGKRLQRPSDDPAGAARLVGLNDALGDLNQFNRNGDEAKSALSVADAALGNAGDLLRETRTLVIQAASAGASSPEARRTMAEKLGRIKEQIVGVANTSLHGRYLFAGQRTETPPFDPADGANTFRGDSGALRAEINRGEYVQTNVDGNALFSSLLNDLDTIKADVLAGNTDALSNGGLTKMSKALDTLLEARGQIGGRINRVEATRDRLEAVGQEFRVMASHIEDTDVAQAIVELQAAQNAYQAALGATAKAFQQSLMDYLR